MKQVTITEFLTDDQIKKCMRIYKEEKGLCNKRLVDEVIQPNIEEINKKLGQDNDPSFLGYIVEYVCRKSDQI